MKNKTSYYLLCFLVLSVIAVTLVIVFSIYFTPNRDKPIKIYKDHEVFEEIKFEFNNFSPGSEKGYTLQFEGNSNGKYLFNFHFNEIGNGELKKYLNVGIKMNGEVVYECSLMELLSGQNDLSFELKILRKEIVEFELIYLMPESIGNEAQNALGKFNLLVSIKEQK